MSAPGHGCGIGCSGLDGNRFLDGRQLRHGAVGRKAGQYLGDAGCEGAKIQALKVFTDGAQFGHGEQAVVEIEVEGNIEANGGQALAVESALPAVYELLFDRG